MTAVLGFLDGSHWKVNSHAVRTLRQLCGGAQEELKLPVNSLYRLDKHASEPPWKQIFQLQSSLQMMTASVDIRLQPHERLGAGMSQTGHL